MTFCVSISFVSVQYMFRENKCATSASSLNEYFHDIFLDPAICLFLC
jgi:hypothetical protein